jgi:hypothetical protein
MWTCVPHFSSNVGSSCTNHWLSTPKVAFISSGKWRCRSLSLYSLTLYLRLANSIIDTALQVSEVHATNTRCVEDLGLQHYAPSSSKGAQARLAPIWHKTAPARKPWAELYQREFNRLSQVRRILDTTHVPSCLSVVVPWTSRFTIHRLYSFGSLDGEDSISALARLTMPAFLSSSLMVLRVVRS